VVWPNAVLASTAVGLLMQLVTPWHSKAPEFTYLEYDGNKGTVTVSQRVALLKGYSCPHHAAGETGEPLFDIRRHLYRPAPAPSWSQKLRLWLAKFLRRTRPSAKP
jgi:molybdopterin-synthase adenylyltransferase